MKPITAVYFHDLFNKKIWDIINNKFQNFPQIMQKQLNSQNVKLIKPPLISEKDILKFHSDNYFNQVKRRWDYKGARLTVGGCVDAAVKIMDTKYHNALCFGVAAGHHAERNYAWGGTYLSVSGGIITKLEERFGSDIRIAILDTDSHHGNGTRDICLGHNNVLHVCFCSSDVVEENGTKICVDSGYKTTDEKYLKLIESEFIKRIETFKPEIIIHLLGHDTAQGDYGNRGLSKEFFLRLVHRIKKKSEEICYGKYLINTHGGSNLDICEYIHPRIIDILAE
ncbi:MAG: hypothetical protein GF364_14590 [Candidatus Lokiarchaeota archaeon]|nr:hypothetical protein [Candidatus Lokiarchaeota archaeon]